MARPLRLNDDGLVYHALSRGNNRDNVFFDDDDFLAFLNALARAQLRYPFRLYGYCLMTNHFHLLLRPESGVAIGRAMQSLLVSHT
jgi:putative transposase